MLHNRFAEIDFHMVRTREKFWQRMLPCVVFGALWYLLVKHLSLYWATDAQYSFGVVWAGDLRLSFLYSLDHSAFDCARG